MAEARCQLMGDHSLVDMHDAFHSITQCEAEYRCRLKKALSNSCKTQLRIEFVIGKEARERLRCRFVRWKGGKPTHPLSGRLDSSSSAYLSAKVARNYISYGAHLG